MSFNDQTAQHAKLGDVWNVIREELLTHFKGEGMPQDAVEWYSRGKKICNAFLGRSVPRPQKFPKKARHTLRVQDRPADGNLLPNKALQIFLPRLYAKSLDYNVLGGKLNRGMAVVDTVEILKGRSLRDEEYLQAAVLGWGVELLQAFFLVSDDIIDSSITRRGQPCWYRVEHPHKVGLISVNDSCMLERAIYYLLKKHFKKEPYYVDLLDLFHEVTYQTEMGQLVDSITAPESSVDLNRFSLKRHSLIVTYKTAYYSFYLPVALGMHICGVPETYTDTTSRKVIKPYEIAKSILLPLGEYFQVQDDFLDFSGTPSQIGKVGTDIVDNKCSWVINTALALASPEQRRILDENYGVKPTEEEKAMARALAAENGGEQGYLGEAEKRVKAVFEEIGIKEKYREYEDGVYKTLTGMIDEIPEGAPGEQGVLRKEVFTRFLDKVYRRQK